MSSIALFELWYGVAKSSRRDFNKKRLETFFAGPIHPLSFEDQDAEIAGVIRADLESMNLDETGLLELLRTGPVQFLVADTGLELRWIRTPQQFEFWKTVRP